jgi:hypothetical protein
LSKCVSVQLLTVMLMPPLSFFLKITLGGFLFSRIPNPSNCEKTSDLNEAFFSPLPLFHVLSLVFSL